MDNAITSAELVKMKERCSAARAGPWRSFVEGRDHTAGSDFIMVGSDEARAEDIELMGATAEDQDFIAHARQDLPRLIAEVERLWTILGHRGGRPEP